MSIRLYVGNLPEDLDRQELASVFAESGDSVSTKVITDPKTGKCRGFGFITVRTPEQADQLIEKFNGYQFKENALKIEKALPRTKGKGDDESATRETTDHNGNNAGQSERSNRRKNQPKSKRVAQHAVGEPQATQPDPRWANELEKLKQLLAAQTTSS
jgi:RNA recognition motif-containing protein